MPTPFAIANFTGFDRNAIIRRQKKWNLGKDIDPKDVFDLKPLSEDQAEKKSLEEARTELAIEDAQLKRIQREKLEGRLADVDEVIEKVSELAEMVEAIIRQSPLDEDRKGDIYAAIRQKAKEWSGG